MRSNKNLNGATCCYELQETFWRYLFVVFTDAKFKSWSQYFCQILADVVWRKKRKSTVNQPIAATSSRVFVQVSFYRCFGTTSLSHYLEKVPMTRCPRADSGTLPLLLFENESREYHYAQIYPSMHWHWKVVWCYNLRSTVLAKLFYING